MAKILIPSRNRPSSLGCVLGFLARFYPGSEVVVADGTNGEYKPRYRRVIDSFRDSLSLEYRPYDADLPFFDRILDALESLQDDLVIMGADDDYPIVDALAKGEAFLNGHPGYITAMGSIVHLRLAPNGRMHARLGQARPIEARATMQRVMSYGEWPFSTTYAVTRREHLVERYKRARTQFLPRFHDFTVGVHDCTTGKLKALDEIGYFCTRNPRYSYLRADDPLIYLRRGEEVLRLVDVYRQDLLKHANGPTEFVRKNAIKLINYRIEELAGQRAHLRPGFSSSALFQDAVVRKQYDDFHGLFAEQHPARGALFDRLKYIVDALCEQGASTTDNEGEKSTYETLDQQSNVCR